MVFSRGLWLAIGLVALILLAMTVFVDAGGCAGGSDCQSSRFLQDPSRWVVAFALASISVLAATRVFKRNKR